MSDNPSGETPEQPQSPPDSQVHEEDEWGPDFDAERARSLITKLRAEARKVYNDRPAGRVYRELESLKAEREAARLAQLSKEEQLAASLARAEAERDHAKQERQDALNRHSVLQEALRQGAVDADAVYRLMDWDAVEYDQSGEPKNVKAAISALLKDKPYLAGQAPAPPVGNPPTRAQQAGKPVFTRAQLNDSRFYVAHRDEILDAMRDGRLVE